MREKSQVKILILLLLILCVYSPIVAVGGPLHNAAKDGDIDKVKELIAKDTDVNEEDSASNTPLILATYFGHTDVVKTLLENGANLTNPELVWITAQKGHKEIMELLISNGANINAKSSEDKSPLLMAIEWKHIEIAELLIDRGADLKFRNKKGTTLLQFATFYDNKDMVEMLLSKGVNINDENSNKKTALNTAVEFGHREIAELLRKHGARLNQLEEIEIDELPVTRASDLWLLKVDGLRVLPKREISYYSLGGMSGSIDQISSIPDYSSGIIPDIGIQKIGDGPNIGWTRMEVRPFEEKVFAPMEITIRNKTNQKLCLQLPDIRLESQDGFFNSTPYFFKIKDQPIYKMVDSPINFPPSEDFDFVLVFITSKKAYRTVMIFPTLESLYLEINKSLE